MMGGDHNIYCLHRVDNALRRRVASVIIALYLVIAFCAGVYADPTPDPYDVMRAAIMSQGQVDYSAERIVTIFSRDRAPRIVHQKLIRRRGDKQRIETLRPPSDAGCLVVSDGTILWEYDPHNRVVTRRQLQPPATRQADRARAAELIKHGVRLQHTGRHKIAERTADAIVIRDLSGKLLRKCWVDAVTGVRLKTEKHDSSGAPYSSSEITAIDYSPNFTAATFSFRPPAGVTVNKMPAPARRMSIAAAEKLAGFSAVIPKHLPPGYVFEADNVAVTKYCDHLTLWLTFSNGVMSFSLFETPWRENTQQAARPSRSATQWYDNGICFTLVGDLRTAEVENLRHRLKR